MPQRHHHLDHTSHTRRRLRMTDIRLHRPQPQWPTTRPTPVRPHQRTRLDRIPQHGPRPMPLHHIHIPHRQPTCRQRPPNHPLLRRTRRRRQPIRRPVLIHRGTPHHRQHPTPRRHRIRQPLHHHQPRTLGEASAIRTLRERLAPAIHRQPPLPRELHEQRGKRLHRHAAGQGEIALPAPQRLAGQVQCHQRGRAGGVDGERRTSETERVGDTPRYHAGHVADHDLRRVVGKRVVPLVGSADEHPRRPAVQRLRENSGVFQRLPGHLQREALLRVHPPRLSRGHPEERRVEIARVVEETPALGQAGAGGEPPSAVAGEVRGGVHPAGHQIPQVIGGAHPAGVPAGHAHDGDRFRYRGLQLAHPGAQGVQLRGRQPQIVAKLVVVSHPPESLVACAVWVAVVAGSPGDR